MRIKREKRGHRYYIVARDEKGRFITYVKWSSKKDKLEQLKRELYVKREKRGHRYYIVARDEKGRFITYVKWSSKKDKLEQLKRELYERIERKLREREEERKEVKRVGERYVLNSTHSGGGKKRSLVFGVTTFIEDRKITEAHKQFAGEIHQVMVDYVENLNVSLTHHEEAIEYVEDWAKWLTSELEDIVDMRLKAYIELDLNKWEVANIKASDYLRGQWEEVIERWKGRL